MGRALLSLFALLLSPFLCLWSVTNPNPICGGIIGLITVAMVVWAVLVAIGHKRQGGTDAVQSR